MSDYSNEIRTSFAKGDRRRDKGLTTPPDVERLDNISYGSHPTWNLLDVYRPKAEKGSMLPVIVIVHGGAWVYGDKDVYQFYGMSLAQRGFVVVNFSYRLAPEYKFPAPIEDTCAVFSWIYKNRDAYGLDAENLFAVGDSAGAHILGLFADLITNPDYKKKLKECFPKAVLSLPRGMHLNAIALNCGKYEFNEDEDKDLNAPILLKDFLPKGGIKAEMKLISPVDFITDKYPPAFVMTCPGDFLCSQARYVVEALTENKAGFCYRLYGSAKKPLHHVFHCNVRLPEAAKCNDDECAFFRENMRGRERA